MKPERQRGRRERERGREKERERERCRESILKGSTNKVYLDLSEGIIYIIYQYWQVQLSGAEKWT